MKIEMRVYLAKENLMLDSHYSQAVDVVVKEQVQDCRQVDCEYLHPSFDRKCELRNKSYTWLNVLLARYVQKVRDHQNAWLKVSVPNLNKG